MDEPRRPRCSHLLYLHGLRSSPRSAKARAVAGWLAAIVAKGDEVLDWREMAARHAGCRVKLVEGGDHALADFVQAYPHDVVRFLGLA